MGPTSCSATPCVRSTASKAVWQCRHYGDSSRGPRPPAQTDRPLDMPIEASTTPVDRPQSESAGDQAGWPPEPAAESLLSMGRGSVGCAVISMANLESGGSLPDGCAPANGNNVPAGILHPSPENPILGKSELSSVTRVSARCCPFPVATNSMFIETDSMRASAAASSPPASPHATIDCPSDNHPADPTGRLAWRHPMHLVLPPQRSDPSMFTGPFHVQGEVVGPGVPRHPPNVFPPGESAPNLAAALASRPLPT